MNWPMFAIGLMAALAMFWTALLLGRFLRRNEELTAYNAKIKAIWESGAESGFQCSCGSDFTEAVKYYEKEGKAFVDYKCKNCGKVTTLERVISSFTAVNEAYARGRARTEGPTPSGERRILTIPPLPGGPGGPPDRPESETGAR